MTGVVVWGLGNVLAGLGTPHLGAAWLYLTYGVIGGIGLGLGYVTPVAAVTKWFPDRRGLASGMVVMGFGLGAFFYNNTLTRIPAFAAAAGEASSVVKARAAGSTALLDPAHVSTVMTTFVLSGIVFAVVRGLCASYVTHPPPPAAPGGAAAAPPQRGVAP